MRGFPKILILSASLLLAVLLTGGSRPTGESFATRSEVLGKNGMIATSQPLATSVGLEILRQGGSAVDAAIAANAALGLTQPMSNGLGGDLFAIVWDPRTKRLFGLNGSGHSPRFLTREDFSAAGITTAIPNRGVWSITVPGCVDGWFSLHERFGRLPMTEVLAPVIKYAYEGIPVSAITAQAWQRLAAQFAAQEIAPPGFRETFTRDGHAPAEGEIWKNPALGRTLAALAVDGRDSFYQGAIAKVLIDQLQSLGSHLSLQDFREHHSDWVTPVSINYRGWDVWELPPNGQGIAALQILKMMEGFDLHAAGFGSPDHVHAFVEAKKLAYADRARFYADPEFSKMPVSQLISSGYAELRRAQIDPGKAAAVVNPGVLQHGDTVILCTADADGMMVSLIQSNYSGFGSGVCIPELGFALQNRGAAFTFEPGHANEYQPRKRPFHTIIPAFVTAGGEPLLAFGVMGGPMQPQGHAQIIMNLRDFGMNLQEASDAPRINHRDSNQPFGDRKPMDDGGRVNLEPGFPANTIEVLARRSHLIREQVGGYGGFQGIYRDPANGVYHGASESREDGMAAGY